MVAIQNLCTSAFYLENGLKKYQGIPSEVVDYYLQSNSLNTAKSFYEEENINQDIFIQSFKITSEVATGNSFEFEVVVSSKKTAVTEFAFTLRGNESQPLYQIFSGHSGVFFKLKKGKNIIKATLDKFRMVSGTYEVSLWLGTSMQVLDFKKQVFKLLVNEGRIREGGPISSRNGYPVIEDAEWKFYNE